MSTPANIYVAIVDDDKSICRALSRLLRVSGFQPISYPSAEAFLADDKHPKFDCMILDIHFDGISGIDLGRHLAKAGSTTPIIFISAHDDVEVQEQAFALGCAAYLHKPQPGPAVIEAIRKAIA